MGWGAVGGFQVHSEARFQRVWMEAEWRQRGPSFLQVVGHLVTGMGTLGGKQVFDGMMEWTWESWHGSRAGRGAFWGPLPSAPAIGRGRGPTTPKHCRSRHLRERTWASQRELGPSGAAPTNSPLTRGSRLPARHSNRVQQGAEGCRLSAQSWHHQQETGVIPPTPQAAWH